jgi:hypothetical protein
MHVETEPCTECHEGWQGEDVCPVCDGDTVIPIYWTWENDRVPNPPSRTGVTFQESA